MKIAFVYDAVYPYVKGGGERRYYELARRLCSRHQVHLYGIKCWKGARTVRTDDGIILHGVCPPMPLYVNGRRSILQALVYALSLVVPLLRERFDLVETSSCLYFAMYVCKLYSLVRQRPFVVAWLEYWGEYWDEYLGKLGRLAQWIERTTTRLPDHIIAISEHTEQALLERGVQASAITTIPLGTDIGQIAESEPAAIESDLIYVGRLIKDKNVDTLIGVVADLVDRGLNIRCSIVGDGPERAALEQLCSGLGLGEQIVFHGFLSRHQDVYALMKSSKVLVLPSTREGFGLVVPEGNACGLPAVVVESKLSAASSLVKQGETGFICRLSVKEIADAVYTLLTDEGRLAHMRRQATAWAQQFDWDRTTLRTESVYLGVGEP